MGTVFTIRLDENLTLHDLSTEFKPTSDHQMEDPPRFRSRRFRCVPVALTRDYITQFAVAPQTLPRSRASLTRASA